MILISGVEKIIPKFAPVCEAGGIVLRSDGGIFEEKRSCLVETSEQFVPIVPTVPLPMEIPDWRRCR